ncbi:MAG: glycosyltransferase [Flavobacteriales bacterium]
MRILQVVPTLERGGAERLALNISSELRTLGHEVMLISLRRANYYSELTQGSVQIANASVYYSLLASDQIITDGYESIVNEFEPDVIHSHLVDSELVSRHNPRKDVAYITHWHGCPSLTNPVPFAERFNREYAWKWNTKRRLLQNYQVCSNHFLCISEFIQKYVKENLSAEESETTVIHNAIDLSRFRPIETKKKDGFRLISIGSLQKNKNHMFLLGVIKNLLESGLNDVYLDIYGEGPEHDFLNDEIKKLNLSDHVVLHGIVNNPEMQLNQAHLLIHSAWHEPFGLIFIEAMACGVPVVSFNTGGPAELIKDGENGYLVEKDDLETFSSRIKGFYDNREQIEAFGQNGIKHAQQFGLTEYVKKIEALYKKRLAVIKK